MVMLGAGGAARGVLHPLLDARPMGIGHRQSHDGASH